MKKYFIFLIITTIIVLACNKSDENTSTIDTFHQEYYNVNIYPALINFKTEIEEQVNLTAQFKSSKTEENFNNLKEQWLVTAKSYAKISAYNLVAVKTLFYDILIYNFSINTTTIENNILENVTFNSDYFNTKSTASKGLGTLEYLLYNNQDSDEAFKLLQENPNRINYLEGVSNEVLVQSNLLIEFWETEYKEDFINSTSISCTQNARCLAFNQLINVLDVIRVTKVGKPAGLENSSNSSVESLEAFRSESSLELIKSAIEEVENAYSNSSVNFADLVDEIADSSEISTAIDASFNDVYTHINAINTSLYTAIINDNSNVDALYTSLFDLVKYFSVDAASTLSVNVLPTDNDGD
ncbi:imelysin family protein [Polaribacter sp. Asnod6-C07]|uniref:imelysin family protein n=1 Tax=Polaribacter sp. Asnod6-C07 TaxID=3160582 RepID=UPI0038656889